jgi:hypothetical protein
MKRHEVNRSGYARTVTEAGVRDRRTVPSAQVERFDGRLAPPEAKYCLESDSSGSCHGERAPRRRRSAMPPSDRRAGTRPFARGLLRDVLLLVGANHVEDIERAVRRRRPAGAGIGSMLERERDDVVVENAELFAEGSALVPRNRRQRIGTWDPVASPAEVRVRLHGFLGGSKGRRRESGFRWRWIRAPLV